MLFNSIDFLMFFKNYFLALKIEKANKYKRLLMYIGLAQGLGILAF